MDYFDRVCRVVNGVKGMVVGAIGARTTPFKTVRIDEVDAAAARHHRRDARPVGRVRADEGRPSRATRPTRPRPRLLTGYTSWEGVPDEAFDNIVRLGVVLDEIVEEYQMDALAVRCWIEMQKQLGISPCVLLGELNDGGVAAACEVDVGNAVAMRALSLASGEPAACLDWNNNYGDDDDKCILFHCGPVPGQPDGGPGPDQRPRDSGQRRGRGLRLSAATSGASRRWTLPSAAC